MAQIQCRYCGFANDVQERRCVRCMRRLHIAAPRPAPEGYVHSAAAAAAPALQTVPNSHPAPRPQTAPAPAPRTPSPSALTKDVRPAAAFQQALFQDGPAASKVIPIPTLTPLRPVAREASPVRRVTPRTGPAPTRRGSDLQRPLEFHDSLDAALPADSIYCDAPVALPVHRIMAAAVDISVVLIALGLFGVILYACGADLSFTRESAPYFVVVTVSTAMFYRLLWCFGNGDSPGMRFAGLRLVDFDGRSPDRPQRLRRQLASLLSMVSAGLGLAWALVDEENLTWHDHISKTFPTPGA